ncbi:hypothetical protein Tco_1302105 [Tanacetum coccineum]
MLLEELIALGLLQNKITSTLEPLPKIDPKDKEEEDEEEMIPLKVNVMFNSTSVEEARIEADRLQLEKLQDKKESNLQ